ncbi:MAG: hypothetical protein ACK4LB_01420 [Spirosomataceae bacterium]
MKNILTLGFFLCTWQLWGQANWTTTVPSSEIRDAGINYSTPIFESSSNQVVFSITGGTLVNYNVQVSRVDSDWSNQLTIFVRRTGTGTGGTLGTINGGTNYQQVSTLPQNFINGSLGLSGTRSNVPVQFRVEGISVLLPSKTYATSIVFTLTD